MKYLVFSLGLFSLLLSITALYTSIRLYQQNKSNEDNLKKLFDTEKLFDMDKRRKP